MFATLRTYHQTPPQRPTASNIGIRRAARIWTLLANAVVLIGVGGVVAGGPLGGPPALAADLTQPQPLARIAAMGGALEGPQHHAGPPVHRTEVNADLKLLLGQNGSPAQVDATARDDTILVAVALSDPYSVDEHIAEQYRLKLVDRTELSSFGLRVVRYRVQDNRPLGPIIANFRKDHRISSVQANVEYGLPTRSGSKKESGPGVDQQSSRYDPQGASLRRPLNRNPAIVSTVGDPRAAAQPGASEVSGVAKATRPSKRSLTYERRRRQLLDQLAAAETARRMVVEQLEELERSHIQEGLEVSGGTSAAPMADRQTASPWPRGEARDTGSWRRANLRRRCTEIKVDPDGYEKALVDLCRTL